MKKLWLFGIALLAAGLVFASQVSVSKASSAGPPGDFTVVSGSCQLRWSAIGDQLGRALGSFVLTIPDVDGDGVKDVAVSSSRRVVEGRDETLLQLFSGQDGALLKNINLAGWIIAGSLVDDLDGDGIPELALGSQMSPIPDCDSGICSGGDHSGTLYIVSPTSGEILLQRPGPTDERNFGFSPTPYLSITPNTLLVGSPFPDPFPTVGRVHVLSARDGNILEDLTPPAEAGHMFGNRALQTDDLNGDGVRDVLVTDPSAPEFSYRGRITALSGADSSVLWAYTGEIGGGNPDILGDDVTVPGDLNQDGVPDVVAGVHNHTALGEIETGEVLAIDGRTGTRLWAVEGRRVAEGLGHGLASLGDLDGDGVPDVLVGAPTFGVSHVPLIGQGGRFAILSGRTGEVLVDVESRIAGDQASDYFGTAVDSLGDVDGDGAVVVIIGAPRSNPGGQSNAGFVTAWNCRAK